MTIHVTTRCACGGRGILCYDDVWGPDLRWSVECDTCDAMGPGRATPGQADRAWSIMHGVALHMVRAAIDMMESEILEIFDRPTKPIGIDVRHIPIGGTTNLPAHREAWHKALAPAPTAVYVTVEVDGVERAYECRPVEPQPAPVPILDLLDAAPRCSCGATGLSYTAGTPERRGHKVCCQACGASTSAMDSIDAAFRGWAGLMRPKFTKAIKHLVAQYSVFRDAQADGSIESGDPSGGAWPTFTAGVPTHTAVFEPPCAPTVTWGGAKMPLRPMPGLKPGMPVLLWRVDGWSIGHLEYETWIRLHESDDIYGLREFQGWVPMPDVGR